MHNDVKKILVSSEEITKREKELADEISKYYKEKNSVPVIVGLLKGSVPFMMGLVMKLDIDCEIDFMDVSSYSGTNSIEVRVIKDIEGSVTDRDVLIVEDIVDTGLTAKFLLDFIHCNFRAKSVKFCSLLDKKITRVADVDADYYGFEVDDKFLIGYGLDYDGYYRNIRYIGYMEKSDLE